MQLKSKLIFAALGLIVFGQACDWGRSPVKILVFSKTMGYRHSSIEPGHQAIAKLSHDLGWEIDSSEEASLFRPGNLDQYRAIVFLNTTGDILNDQQQLVMMRYIQAGGGFVGIHSAADTEYDWPWYGDLVGAYFKSHPDDPNVREAVIDILDPQHESTKHLDPRWPRTDEWYNYRDFDEGLQILLNLDEETYEGGTNGKNHPIAWYRDFDGGRSFYTGGGHTAESFSEEEFLKHLLGGIIYAIGGKDPLDYGRPGVAPEENRFQKVVLEDNLNEPMELEVLPDGRILFIERRGDIRLFDQSKGKSEVVSHLAVHTKFEDGLLGMALDPGFAENHWIYLFYSPPGPDPKQHVSRFDFHENRVDFSSEKVLLEIVTQREECCHSAGCLEFGPEGNLWISTGDDTNPFDSDGYSPIDERPDRGPWDAQRTSSNANDLRGKICRIRPQADGTYTIPDGNLFPKDGSKGRPEIYAMGCKNPYRLSIDQHTGYLYWGDVGPDAGNDLPSRGPKGYDEINQARQPGFYGWPYFVADNKAYHRYEFAQKKSLEKFDAEAPKNTSPNNTGTVELPPAQPAFIWYPYDKSNEFPLVGTGGRNAMAGPVYYYDDFPDSEVRFPPYYDKKLFTYDWIRGWVMTITLDSMGNFVRMERFLPSTKFSNPNDMLLGPGGDLYMLEYGTAWFQQNKDARLVHLRYISGNRAPIARLSASATEGGLPFTVAFSAAESSDPDGDQLDYHWLIGEEKFRGESLEYTFEEVGQFPVVLTVKDQDGLETTDQLSIAAGNNPPDIEIVIHGNESFFFPDGEATYEVIVNDQEDGTIGEGINEEDVTVTIDFLEQGADINMNSMEHQTLATPTLYLAGRKLIGQSDCAACHFKDRTSVGPSYLEISAKYRSQNDARGYLVDKVLNGGGGVWGVQAMAAHPQLTDDEAGKMIDYILSLKDESEVNRVPINGRLQYNHGKGEDEDGKYIIIASYTDRGSGIAAPIARRVSKVLTYPKLMASDYDTLETASKVEPSADQISSLNLSGDIDLIVARNTGWIGFYDIDLTSIASFDLGLILPSEFSIGGEIIATVGGPQGQEIGRILVEQQSSNLRLKRYNLAVGYGEGREDLYFRFESKEDGIVGLFVDIRLIPDEIQ